MPESPPAPGWYRWKVVLMLWGVCFLSYADRQAIFSVFPRLKVQFGFSPVQLGLIGSAFMGLYALGAPIAGIVADRFSRKGVIIVACAFWSAATALTAGCRTFWHFIAIRSLSGASETLYFPAALSLLSDYHPNASRSKAFSFHQSAVYVGTIGGSWAGAWFAQRGNWPAVFLLFGGAGVALALFLVPKLREPIRTPSGGDRAARTAFAVAGYVTLLKDPTAILLMLAFLCANAVASVFLIWTPSFLVDKFHFQLGTAGLSGALFIHLASASAVPVAGVISDRLARGWTGGRMGVQAAGLLTGAAFVALVGVTENVSVLLGSMAAFGVCKGFYDANIFASLYDVVAPENRGRAAGLMNCVGWGGGALGPFAVGWATQHGPYATEMANMSIAISAGAAVYLIGCGLLLAAALRAPSHDVDRSGDGSSAAPAR